MTQIWRFTIREKCNFIIPKAHVHVYAIGAAKSSRMHPFPAISNHDDLRGRPVAIPRRIIAIAASVYQAPSANGHIRTPGASKRPIPTRGSQSLLTSSLDSQAGGRIGQGQVASTGWPNAGQRMDGEGMNGEEWRGCEGVAVASIPVPQMITLRSSTNWPVHPPAAVSVDQPRDTEDGGVDTGVAAAAPPVNLVVATIPLTRSTLRVRDIAIPRFCAVCKDR